MRRRKIQVYPEWNKGFALRLLISTAGIFGLLYLIAWFTQVRPHKPKSPQGTVSPQKNLK